LRTCGRDCGQIRLGDGRKRIADSIKCSRILTRRIYPVFQPIVSAFLKAATCIFARELLWGGDDMVAEQGRRASYVIGSDGSPLTLADLPPPNVMRWVVRRKADVVAAVRGGLLSLDEACRRYNLTVEEFLSWQHAVERHGLPGLRTTRVQHYRA
jgi:hypothetical protein